MLALRDATMLFSASPPAYMLIRKEMPLVLCVTVLRPIAQLLEAIIFARIVLIEQRMMILKSKTLEQQACVNAAMTQINLPDNLKKRINMFHQFLEIQHDKQACELLYGSSSNALYFFVECGGNFLGSFLDPIRFGPYANFPLCKKRTKFSRK